MTLRAADLRFVLPNRVDAALVLGTECDPRLAEIARGLGAAGVEIGSTVSRPDVVIAAVGRAGDAMRRPAPAHLLIGTRTDGGLPLLVRGDVTRPLTIVPARPSAGLRHYLTEVARPPTRRARLRNRGLATALRTPLPPARLLPAAAVITVVAERDRAPIPRLVRAAAALGAPAEASWVLGLGAGDDLQRATFRLLRNGRPEWLLKFSRVAGADASFVRDEEGLRTVRAAGTVVTAHAPAHFGRFEVDGLPASLESAAPGRPLLELLDRRPLALLDRIAGWVVDVGAATAAQAAALRPERDRLVRDVLPHWLPAGAPPELVDRVPEVPAVLVHNDLGSWNIISDGRQFTAVDWESARPAGMPLWDLCYLLADVLARLDGPADPETLLRRALALFAGRSRHSALLFGWVRTAVARLHLPAEAVGPLVTLGWLHHGLSAEVRARTLAGAAPAPVGHLAMLAEPWLADPALGPAWSAWT